MTRRPEFLSPAPPPFDEVKVKSLYTREIYDVRTPDGWVLQVTRYKPVPQNWAQPLLDEPLLLVHGWSQNRHAFSCGEFVKHLLFDGADVHILELRGHGRSNRELQLERAKLEGRRPPRDLDWDWDIDSYLLDDLPAAVQAVKEKTGRARITLVGNSMGGMLGYGYAATHQDLLALATLAAPGQLGRGFPALRLIAALGLPTVGPAVDTIFAIATQADRARHGAASLIRRLRRSRLLPRAADRAANRLAHPESSPQARRFSHVPMDRLLTLLSALATPQNLKHLSRLQALAQRMGSLFNPKRVAYEEMQWLLQRGGEKEPRKVVEQFARWIRDGRMTCERNGFDYRSGFAKIEVPLAVLYGDLDRLASRDSTGVVVRSAKSEYKLWRSVAENSHLELTMGADVRHCCAAIRELVLFAKGRESGPTARRKLAVLRALGGGAAI